METQLKLPRTISDLRLYHLEAIAGMTPTMGVYDKLALASELTELPMETLKRVSLAQITKIISHHLQLISDYKTTKPKKVIKVGGVEYELIKGVGEQPLAWHIDIGHFGTKDASNVAAFCYIEKGMQYCEMDSNDNILNPVTPRATNFKVNLGADTLINLGFFLSKKSKAYKSAYTEIQKQRLLKLSKAKKLKENKEGSTGKTKSTQLVES